MTKLQDKVAIVTGGSSGIGQAIVRKLSEEGAVVYNLDQNEDESSDANFIAVDVSDQKNVKRAVDSVAAHTGTIDILINNAGIAHIGQADTTSEADFEKIFYSNLIKRSINGINIINH